MMSKIKSNATATHLLQDPWKNVFLVHCHVDRLQLTQPDQVCTNKDPQLHPLPLPLVLLPSVALVTAVTACMTA